MQLHEKAMIAKLVLHQWQASKTDKQVSMETRQRYRTGDKAGRWVKRLMDDQLADVRGALNAVEEFHREMTLPWGDTKGERILLSRNYKKYAQGIAGKLQAVDEKVDELILKWPECLNQARRELGDTFNQDEFPLVTQLRKKFWVENTVDPLPNAEDWRVNLSAEEIGDLQRRYEDRLQANVSSAMADLWKRIYGPVKKMAETLSNPSKGFHKTLVSNILDVTSILPDLNLASDPALETMRQEIEQRLCGYTPQALKTDDKLRQDTAAAANDIAQKMAAFMGAPMAN